MNRPLTGDNYNILWSQLIVGELKRLGCRGFFVSPGYRNAPLIAALVQEDGLDVVSCPDERAGAYQALGYAKQQGAPAVLMCTSGTAAANYFPAVIEAQQSQIPLVVISADRPFAMVHSGANQVINQMDLFGAFIKAGLAFPSPSGVVSPDALVRLVEDGVEKSRRYPKGPVHWNLPFDEPLEPRVASDGPVDPTYLMAAERCLTERSAESSSLGDVGHWLPAQAQLNRMQKTLGSAKRGLLLVGGLASASEKQMVGRLVQALGWPTYFDITSGLRFMEYGRSLPDLQAPFLQKWLKDQYRPDAILHVGDRLTSKWYDRFLQSWQGPYGYHVITAHDGLQDPTFRVRQQLTGDVARICHGLLEWCDVTGEKINEELWAPVARWREQVRDTIQNGPFSFAVVAQTVLSQLTPNAILYLGNSSTIRAFDAWGWRGPEALDVQASRGVSGIEGQLATAMGIARAHRSPVTAVLGDITLIHDLNSLLELGRSQLPTTVVVINNQQGAIFGALPIGSYPEVLSPYLNTPHGFHFDGIAAMSRLRYQRVEGASDLMKVLQEGYQTGKPSLVECILSADIDHKHNLELLQSEKGNFP